MPVLHDLCSLDGGPVGALYSLEAASDTSSQLTTSSAISASTAGPASPCAVAAVEPESLAPLALFADPQGSSVDQPTKDILAVLSTAHNRSDRVRELLLDDHGSAEVQPTPAATAQVDSSPLTTSSLSPAGQPLKGKGAGSLAHLLPPCTTPYPDLMLEPCVQAPRTQSCTFTLDPAWLGATSASLSNASVALLHSISLPLSSTTRAPACAPVQRAATVLDLAGHASSLYLLGLSRTSGASYEPGHSGHWPVEWPDREDEFTLVNPSLVCRTPRASSPSSLTRREGTKRLKWSHSSESPALVSSGPASPRTICPISVLQDEVRGSRASDSTPTTDTSDSTTMSDPTDTVGADKGTEAPSRDLFNPDGLMVNVPYSYKRYRNRKLLSDVREYMYEYLDVPDFRHLVQLEPRGQWVQRLLDDTDGRVDGAETKDVYHLDFSHGGNFYEANHALVRALVRVGMELVDAKPESYGVVRGVLRQSHIEHIAKDLLDSARSGFRIVQNERHRSASEEGKGGGINGPTPGRRRRQSSRTTAGGRRLTDAYRAARCRT